MSEKNKENKEEVKLVEKKWVGTEWAGEEDRLLRFKVDDSEAEVYIAHPIRVKRGEVEPISVAFDGMLMFEGDIKEFKEEFPELFEKSKDEIEAMGYEVKKLKDVV